MHFFLAILLFAPSIAVVLAAEQAPLTSDSGSCLSSPSYKSCCPTQQSSGKGGISGSTFEYTCASWPSGAVKHVNKSLTPAHCAEVCAQDPQCVAGAWSTGTCYITKDPAYKRFGPSSINIILLVKTDDAFNGSKSGGTGRQNAAECENEKDTMRSQMFSQCNNEKHKLQTSCKDDIRKAEESCKQEKTALEAKAASYAQDQTQCETDKAQELTDARTQCDADKTQQLTDAQTQCDASKSDIEKQLQQCQDQQGHNQNNQQESPEQAECRTILWRDMCGGTQCADRFTVEGVEYERRCGVATLNTKQRRISTTVYRTPWDCLKAECNGVANCMGIGWTDAFVSLLFWPRIRNDPTSI
ncbi:hypothetical protein BDP55DRAFT_628745 [Colletotrichum godetiae]|uniref:Apple domain-containing protein n=1 Tax=Colletotrichum godetiae TaxID=1209918 RepID=A0AAJ0ATC2_9PEZI|nr:uncharacterized protein BDP55DRAFT_628745 [Colletotrichum godetiae]KAK1689423.1 hypothetical protein BDP55DRAFT_628745 [Colletotrichum godetiae]